MAEPARLSGLLKSSGVYALGTVLNRLGGFLLLPLYTSQLTVTEYGTVEYLYAISSVLGGLLSAGLASATLRFYFDFDDARSKHRVISTNLLGSAALSIGGVSLFWLAYSAGLLNYLPAQIPRFALVLVLIIICLEMSTEVCLAYIRAMELPTFYVAVSVLKLATQCAVSIYLVRVLKLGVTGVLSGNLVAISIGWLVLVVYCLRSCGVGFDTRLFKRVLRYCFPYLGTALFGVVLGNFDRFLIGAKIGVDALGIYAVGLKFSRIMAEFVGVPFNLAFGSFRYSIMKRPDASSVQSDVVRYLACVLAIIGLALCYFLIDVLRLMTGPQYWAASSLMPLLVATSALGVLTVPLQTGILYEKRTEELFYITLAAAAVSIPLMWLLCGIWGLMGVCTGLFAGSVVAALLTARFAHPHFPVKYGRRELTVLFTLWVLFSQLPSLLSGLTAAQAIGIKVVAMLVFMVAVVAGGVIKASELRAMRAFLRRQSAAK